MKLSTELQLILDQLLEGANEFLGRGEQVQPAVFCFKLSNEGVSAADYFSADPFLESDAKKELLMTFMNNLLKKDAADIVVLVTEAWIVKLAAKDFSAKDVAKVRASQHPDKQEIVLFSVLTRTQQFLGEARIERRENGSGVAAHLELMPIEGGEGTLVRDRQEAVPTRLH